MKTTNKLLPLTTFVAAAMSFAIPAYATDYGWTGGGETTGWSDAANWGGTKWVDGTGNTASFAKYDKSYEVLVDGNYTAGGLTVSEGTYTLNFSKGASVTVTDGSGDARFLITSRCNLTITGGTVTMDRISVQATLTVTGGNLVIYSADDGISDMSGGTITMTGGTLTAYSSFYIEEAGNLSIEGGEVALLGETTLLNGEGSLKVSAGKLTVTNLTQQENSELTVTGGTAVIDNLYQESGSGINVSGTGTVEITTSTGGQDNAWIKVSGSGTLILDVAVTGTATGSNGLTISFADDSVLILSQSLLEDIAATGDFCDLLQAETITFGDTTIDSTTTDLSGVIGDYVQADGYDLEWQYDSEHYMLQVKATPTATPEPSMFSLFFGLAAIGLVATRRRRR